ncbi:hypothetical protein DAI22_10g030300 [Oryza sativa Japonica Group]|nr:hypothetical protein DAI22_10g030300 [Oryza sativa Japonica Group]
MPTGMPSLLSRNIMQSLVSIDFHGSHTRDRFCTICLRAFSSERCLDHSMHHPVAEQPNVYVLHVIRRDGWLLIPYQQLPSDMIIGIRKVQLEDGSFGVPLRPRLPPIQDGEYICSRLDCEEGVQFAADICSILCKHHVPD